MNKTRIVILLCALALGAVLVLSVVYAQTFSAASTSTGSLDNAALTNLLATAKAKRTVVLPPAVSGIVSNAQGPVSGAIVQVQGTPNQTTTDANGGFTLTQITATSPITVTAWSAGHYIGWALLDPDAADWKGGQDIAIRLEPHFTSDNPQYAGFEAEGKKGTASCAVCHREHPEWQADAHSQTAENPRFESMYRGTDLQGRVGQPTRYEFDGSAIPPDPSQPYYGPGFRLDQPDRAGSCSTCHTPLAANIPNQNNCSWLGCHTNLTTERSNSLLQPGVVPVSLFGRAAEGINCEFCHQIGDVLLNADTKLPNSDMPGILSLRLFRPPQGQNLFFGTLVDVTRQDSYLPLQSESKFCAACHYGVLGGVVGNDTVTGGTLIYGSYAEWLDSPYSDPQTGKTCQDCHMPKADANFMVFPERGGITRDYVDLHNHEMLGIENVEFMKSAVTMKTGAERAGNLVEVDVDITNDKTGHHVPTDAPIRQMILIVEAFDANGQALPLARGPVNPAWAGNYANTPGKTFAKVLQDKLTGQAPTASFWRETNILEDTRLAPLATDSTRYEFKVGAGQPAQIKVRLVYRRAMQELMEQKGWNDPDLVMAEQTIQVK